jgi:hypothetical protein
MELKEIIGITLIEMIYFTGLSFMGCMLALILFNKKRGKRSGT